MFWSVLDDDAIQHIFSSTDLAVFQWAGQVSNKQIKKKEIAANPTPCAWNRQLNSLVSVNRFSQRLVSLPKHLNTWSNGETSGR